MILVTGARGFIGRHVCSALSTHGKDVIALDRRAPDALANAPPYPVLEFDIRDRGQIEQVFERHSLTGVVHLASLLNTASRKNPLDATQVNVVGSLNLLEAARRFHVPKLIYGSSISVYGSKSERSQAGVLETEPAAPEDVYGAAKRYVEIVGETYRQRFGIQFVALRISSVLGPGALNTSSPWRSEIFEKIGLPYSSEVTFPYSSDQALPLVHVEDVADMIARLVDARQISFALYNTPSETWALDDLAAYIASLDSNLQISFGQSTVSGIPKVIDGQRFVTEFKYTPVSMRERLRRAAKSRREKVSLGG